MRIEPRSAVLQVDVLTLGERGGDTIGTLVVCGPLLLSLANLDLRIALTIPICNKQFLSYNIAITCKETPSACGNPSDNLHFPCSFEALI